MAENWSRKDRIRAGSVSGPWRSAPRPDAADRPAGPGSELVPVSVAVPGSVMPPPVVESAVVPVYEPIDGPDTRRRSVAMAAWIGFGLVFVAASVTAAFLLQPEPVPVTPPLDAETAAEAVDAPPAPATEEAPTATAEPMAPAAPAPDLSAVGNVRLRVGSGFAGESALTTALGAAGVADVRVEQVPFAVNTSRVGYYRPEDLAAAQALAAFVAPLLGLPAPVSTRDYGQLLADPEPGRLDLWIAGPPDP
jgi:hypothetical protein